MNSETSIFDKKTAGLFIIILIIALTARIINLELRPLHHDETVRAFMIQGIADGNPWKHHMGFHGPFLFYANALSFKIFGESTFSLRIAESIFGGLIILLLIPIRSHIGNRGFLFSAALIALSPALIYFSRMTIQTPFILFFELATVVFAFSYSNSKNPIYAYLTAISIALAFTVKETTYVLLGMFGPYLAVKFILSLFRKQGRIRKKTKLFKANLSKWKMRLKNNAPVIISAILLFLVFYLIPYSSFLQELENVKSSLGLFQFWYDRVQYRHTKSVDYYFKIVLDVEFIPVIFAIVGLIYSIFRRNEFRTAVSYWSIAAFSVYSYIPTKEAWVFPHILPPIILLAGIGVEGVYLELARKKRFVGLGKPVFTIILIYFLAAYGLLAYEKNFVSYSAESNSLTYVQAYPDVEKIVERIENLSFKKTGGRDLDIVYAFEEDYPLRWYLRDYKNVAYYKGPVGGIYGWNGTTWGGEGSISWADDEVQSGNRSVKISSEKGVDGSWLQVVNATGGREYTLSGWVKTLNIENINASKVAQVFIRGGEGSTIIGESPSLTGITNWTFFEIPFTLPEEENTIRINLAIGGWGFVKGTVWYDNIKLNDARVINPDFEEGRREGQYPGVYIISDKLEYSLEPDFAKRYVKETYELRPRVPIIVYIRKDLL